MISGAAWAQVALLGAERVGLEVATMLGVAPASPLPAGQGALTVHAGYAGVIGLANALRHCPRSTCSQRPAWPCSVR